MLIDIIWHFIISILLTVIGVLLFYILNSLLDIPVLKTGSKRVRSKTVYIAILILAVIICNVLIYLAGG
jgi:hypothetical protein